MKSLNTSGRFVVRPSILWMLALSLTQACDRAEVTPTSGSPVLLPAVVPEVSNSEHYRHLETATPERQARLDKYNQKLSKHLQSKPANQQFGKWLYKKMNGNNDQINYDVDANRSIQLRELGVGKATVLNLVTTKDGVESVEQIFSTASLPGKAANLIVELSVAPGARYFYLVISPNGSTDEMNVLIYDIEARKVLETRLTSFAYSLTWVGPTSILFDRAKNKTRSTMAMHELTPSQATSDLQSGSILHTNGDYVLMSLNQEYILRNLLTGTQYVVVDENVPSKILEVSPEGIYLQTRSADAPNGEIRRYPLTSEFAAFGEVIVESTELQIKSAWMSDDAIFVERRNGADRNVSVYDLLGKATANFIVPNCCSIADASWEKFGETINVILVSAATSSVKFTYNVITKSWDRDPAETLKIGELQFQTDIFFAKSVDGTQVPVRVTRRADLIKNGEQPVLIRSYGGFGASGYLDPSYSLLTLDFLRRGGILADPGLRGGNEYGTAWHKAAQGEFKFRTYEDLVAAADFMVTDGWTRPAKIISMGTSNGGLTVAATALLYPNHFGLVIPVAGVLDLLGKEELDPAFRGWSGEYGNAHDEDAREHLAKISPLELAKNFGNTNFLVVTGDSDTRVNAAHSIKFVAALQDAGAKPEQLDLLSVRAAGHWVQSLSYSNAKAWKVNFGIWSKIHEQAGWTWTQP